MWNVEIWFAIGAIVGPIWALGARAAGVSQVPAVLLAPVATVAITLELIICLLALAAGDGVALQELTPPAGFWRKPSWLFGNELWTGPMILGAAVPAAAWSYLVTRRAKVPFRRGRATLGAVVLAPGFLLVSLGLIPASVRYAEEKEFVARLAPRVEQFIQEERRCPTESDMPALTTEKVGFLCRDDYAGFRFCVYAGFDAVQCWDSDTKKWWFEE